MNSNKTDSWAAGSNFDIRPKLWWAFGEESRGPKIDWHGRIKSVSGTPNYFGFIFTPVPRICVSFFPDHVSGVEGQSAIWHQLIGGCPIQLAPATNSHPIVSHKPDILKLYWLFWLENFCLRSVTLKQYHEKHPIKPKQDNHSIVSPINQTKYT